MDHFKEAKEFAKKQGANYLISRPDWHGHEVWQMSIQDPSEDPIEASPPGFIILERSFRMMSDREAMAYMSYLNDEYGYEDDETTLKGFEERVYRI